MILLPLHDYISLANAAAIYLPTKKTLLLVSLVLSDYKKLSPGVPTRKACDGQYNSAQLHCLRSQRSHREASF